MNRLSPRILCLAYLLLLLLAGIFFLPMPYLLLALATLLVMLFITIRPQSPGISVAATTIAIFLTPLVLEPMIGNLPNLPPLAARIITVVLSFPLYYFLDHHLRYRSRQIREPIQTKGGRHATHSFMLLLMAALLLIVLSPVLNTPVLFFTGIAFTLYLIGTLIWILFTIPGTPLSTDTTVRRIIAGTSASVPLHITSRAPVSLNIQLRTVDPWVSASIQDFTLDNGEAKLELNITPPLAGTSKPQLVISASDPRGFIQVDQVFEPLQLNVIPRARYSEWLARKYLEQTANGVTMAATLPYRVMPKRGTDYYKSRNYQPGDQLKDIDWKHTTKLRQIIVKEYTESNDQAAVIAANLTAKDAEEADKLAFNLITTALTLASEGIPTALAAYNHERAVLVTPTLDPNEILRQTLSLVEEITLVTYNSRQLEHYNIARIRGNITRLRQVESEPAQRLLDIFEFEYRTIEEAANNHPATIALSAAAEQSPTPAVILLISPLNHDAEAVMVTTEKLSRRKFTTMPVENAV
jgi:hypothetical protein